MKLRIERELKSGIEIVKLARKRNEPKLRIESE